MRPTWWKVRGWHSWRERTFGTASGWRLESECWTWRHPAVADTDTAVWWVLVGEGVLAENTGIRYHGFRMKYIIKLPKHVVPAGVLTTAMSFFSFSKAISHFCRVFRGHLQDRGQRQLQRSSQSITEPIKSVKTVCNVARYLVFGSVRMLSKLFILLRSFFLSVNRKKL